MFERFLGLSARVEHVNKNQGLTLQHQVCFVRKSHVSLVRGNSRLQFRTWSFCLHYLLWKEFPAGSFGDLEMERSVRLWPCDGNRRSGSLLDRVTD